MSQMAVGSLFLAAVTAAARPPPHLVFLLGDEVGWNNVGWHSNITLSPRMTELARTGITLDRHYSQRWCAPTRTALMTGRYPYNVGLNQYNHGVEEERSAVPKSFDMLPKLLKEAAVPYRTHMLGKWHLGFFSDAHTPVGRGFDSSFGFFCGDSTHDTRGSQVSHTCKISVTDLYNSSHIANTSSFYRDRVYNTYMYAGQAESLIKAHDQTFPFFLYMAFQNCHAPYQVPQKYQAMYPALPANKSQRCFNAMVSAMDDSVGTIMDALHDTGMYGNTILVYSSDNGGPDHMSNNMPLRGAKFGLFEGSFRVPAFVHSAMLPAASVGKTSEALVFVADWYVIFARLAGVAASVVSRSGPVRPDGIDTWDAILSVGSVASPRTMIVHEYNPGSVVAIRSGDFKLIWGNVGTSEWIADVSYPTGCTALLPPINVSASAPVVYSAAELYTSPDEPKPPTPPAGPGAGLSCTEEKPCLFNVVADPTEQRELAASLPVTVKELQAALMTYVADRYTGTLDVATTSEADYCAIILKTRWVQPYDDGQFPPRPEPGPTPPVPPAPPAPPDPAAAADFTGIWAQNHAEGAATGAVEMMRVVAQANGAVAITPLNCTGCCWSAATGTLALDGQSVEFTASGCASGPKKMRGVLVRSAKVLHKAPFGLELMWSPINISTRAAASGWAPWFKMRSAFGPHTYQIAEERPAHRVATPQTP